KGDGVTDDLVPISEAIVAAEASGGIVYFPPGTYLITEELIVSSANVILRGMSRTLSAIECTGTEAGVKIAAADCSVSALKVSCSGTHAIFLTAAAARATVVDSWMSGNANGAFSSADDVVFERNVASECGSGITAEAGININAGQRV